MAVTYSFQENILRMNCEGIYPSDAIIEAFESALADPAFPPENARLLLDVTRSKSLADRPVDDLRRVAEYLAKRGDRVGHRCAILAESDVHFGLMRMAVVFAELYQAHARVFKTEDEAVIWLNQGPPVSSD
jgi:hypothetical protein